MIIVSQDKKLMINFNNFKVITTNSNGQIGVWFNCSEDSDDNALLGKYATEERAKEVLQEIIKSYRHYRTAECDGYTNVLEETAVFEMPEK